MDDSVSRIQHLYQPIIRKTEILARFKCYNYMILYINVHVFCCFFDFMGYINIIL